MNSMIILKNDIRELQRLKQTMVEYGSAYQIPDAIIQDVNLALEEMVSNIIFHGYEDTGPHQIEIRVKRRGDALFLEISDDGKPFNPLKVPSPNLDIPFGDREITGMGIHLAKALMDELGYRTERGKNVLMLKRRLS